MVNRILFALCILRVSSCLSSMFEVPFWNGTLTLLPCSSDVEHCDSEKPELSHEQHAVPSDSIRRQNGGHSSCITETFYPSRNMPQRSYENDVPVENVGQMFDYPVLQMMRELVAEVQEQISV